MRERRRRRPRRRRRRRPLRSFPMIRRPSVSRILFIECSGNGRSAYRAPKADMTAQVVDGLTSQSEWTGVPLATLLREIGARREATWVIAEGGDGSKLVRSIPMQKATDD